ncbi:zinc finger protein OZF-like isoform X1 [Tachysurus fulvidraco]|uniref:zinc finger protein OZF-like isoform X1 n=1 Tax=Tachysurus fulvidraco TaxID=1234273 RepID=UPI001FEE2138|nr:zinc finger protein OZF-like isoform X1 [Tachysurus fulvidraco]
MESAEDDVSSFPRSLHPPAPALSLHQGDVQTERDGGTSGCLGDITHVDHQKHVKKEEPEDEGYLCWMSSSAGHINPVDQQKNIKKEEPEDEDNLYEKITIEQITPVDQKSNGLQSKHVKEEASEDEGYVCTSVCEVKDSQFQVFTCSWCSLSYTAQMYLHKHVRRCHHEQYKGLIISGEIKCENLMPACSSNIQQTIYRSVNSNTSSGLCSCSRCGKSFDQQSKIQQHQCLHAGEKPYCCSQCGKSFVRQSSLQQHQHIHTGQKPYSCSECGKSFIRHCNLESHRRTHTGERPFLCPQCGKTFITNRYLKAHQVIHKGEKPYDCLECGKSFIRHSNLQIHRRIHTGEKPYCCTECGKSFSQQSSLHQHQRIHIAEKPIQCLQCGQRFTYSGAFNIHKCPNVEPSACVA